MNLGKKGLLILGTSLYWAEGYKRLKIKNGRTLTNHPVSLTNSDPDLVKTFIKFLTEYCQIPISKIKVSLRIFPHQNEDEIKRFWSSYLRIPKQNFRKTLRIISRSSLGKRPFNRLEYGVIQVVVADTNLFHKILGYIEKIKRLI